MTTTYTKQYAKIDSNGDMVLPIKVVIKATLKNVGKACLVNNVEDPTYCARKQFGSDFLEVEFEDGVPLFCFTKTITEGKAIKDQALITTCMAAKDFQDKKVIEFTWIEKIKAQLNIATEDKWSMAEKKVSRNILPTEKEFEEYDATFKFN